MLVLKWEIMKLSIHPSIYLSILLYKFWVSTIFLITFILFFHQGCIKLMKIDSYLVKKEIIFQVNVVTYSSKNPEKIYIL